MYLHALQVQQNSPQVSMTTSWKVSPEYITDIWQAGRQQALFGGSISAQQYQLCRNGLALGDVQKEDLTFKVMRSCRDLEGRQQFSAAFHAQNEYGEISAYAGVYTKRPEEVVPVLQEVQTRYKPGGRPGRSQVMCDCSSRCSVATAVSDAAAAACATAQCHSPVPQPSATAQCRCPVPQASATAQCHSPVPQPSATVM
jgi:hypothetical protein